MNRTVRVVTPYRPFPPESAEHLALGPFDWVAAIEMLRTSVARSCHCETVSITDVDTILPGPTRQYLTRERRLMLWILEVCLCYLAGPDFDRNTIMLSPDQLVFADLTHWFAADFGMLVRPDHPERPILNAVQWWPLASRDALVDLYTRALEIAKTLPEDLIVWGADTEPFRQLFDPIEVGIVTRQDLRIRMVNSRDILQPCSLDVQQALDQGLPVGPKRAVIDFRYTRKKFMRAFYDATIGKVAVPS